MQAVTDQYLAALRAPHNIRSSVLHSNLITGLTTALDIEDGSVTCDWTQPIRRSLSLTLPPVDATWNLLNTAGAEITVTKTTVFIDRTTWTVPVGVFIVDAEGIGYAPGSTLTMTCPDRWLKVTRAKMRVGQRASVPSNSIPQEIKRLVEGAWSTAYPFPGWSQFDTSVTTKVGYLSWDNGDRSAAVTDLATSAALECFFDADGLGVLRPTPIFSPASVPVWTVDAGLTGVMKAADRARDRSTLRNAVSVNTSATDIVITPALAENTDGTDPLNINGPLGYVLDEYTSPSIRDGATALKVANTLLSRHLGFAKSLSLDASPNDALEEEDVINVVFPQTDPTLPVVSELHVIDSVVLPLTPSGSQAIQTRATGPIVETGGT